MKIIIISGAAPPEPITAGRVHWDIAYNLATMDHTVWLISPYPSRPLGVVYERHKGNRITRINQNYTHVNINSFTYPKYNLFYRTYESLDFGLKAIRFVNREIIDYDLMYASPWAFLGQLMIVIFRKYKRAPLVMNVQDLYPESFLTKIGSNFIKTLLQPLYLIDKYIANNSTHITVISESLKQVYVRSRKIRETKISVIHNWQDESEFVKPVMPKEQVLQKYTLNVIDGSFIYMYLGNIGPVANVESIVMAFADLHIQNAVLVIAGSGSCKDRCQSLVGSLGLSNSLFIEVPPGLQAVVELQSMADILLLPIHPEAANSSIPSKLIAYMFSGKPVITSANGSSETALAVKESGCGWIIGSNDNTEWIQAMKKAHGTSSSILQAMGKSGFEYAMKNYSKKEGMIKIGQLFDELKN